MGMGGSASRADRPLPPPPSSLPGDNKYATPWRERVIVTVCITGWFSFSLASLFLAKYVLHAYKINEAVFTLWQFSASVIFGHVFTKVLRWHSLANLNRDQLRAIVPLSAAFLVKEVLKYASLARVSVNLVNTIRSLGPLFNVTLEFILFRHRPPSNILWSLVPIIVGVALTSIDELQAASLSGVEIITCVLGFMSAVLSTAINNGQNIYSKILFGKERIDPVSLQIYLSAISLVIMTPVSTGQLLHHSFTSPDPTHRFFAPSPQVAGFMLLAGFVNFVSSQLAFNTLHRITSLSYSVANTFKRVCIAIIAIFYFNEHLSLINGAGITISIAGVFVYERVSRAYKESRIYRRLETAQKLEDRLESLDLPSDATKGGRLSHRSLMQSPKPNLSKYPHTASPSQSMRIHIDSSPSPARVPLSATSISVTSSSMQHLSAAHGTAASHSR